MRLTCRVLPPVLFLTFGWAHAAPAGGCEPAPEVKQALEELSQKSRDMKYAERLAFQRPKLEALVAQHPREIAAHRRYFQLIRSEFSEELAGLRARYQKQGAERPGDAVSVYLAGFALSDYNTPESIRLLETAKSLDPAFAWPYYSLTTPYGSGKYADRSRAADHIATYFRLCPDSVDGYAQWHLARFGAPAVQVAMAKRLRERLGVERDPKILAEYATLWALEFRLRPIPEHDQLRKQVAEDLQRLESDNPKPDAEWFEFLKNGYKQSGATRETLTALDDRLLREFPGAPEALSILQERFRKDHPDPKAEDSAEAWEAHARLSIEATERWMAQFPKETYLRGSLFFLMEGLPSIPRDRVAAAAEDTLLVNEERWGPNPNRRLSTAAFYLKNKMQAARAAELVESARPLMEKQWRRDLERDTLTDDDLKDTRKWQNFSKQRWLEHTLRAYALAGRTEDVRRLKPQLEGEPPQDRDQVSKHWWNLALLASTEGRQADALAYYQSAIHARPKPPNRVRGRVDDPLLDEARALWTELGGTEVAWNLWSKPKELSKELAEGRWERPTKQVKPFDLTALDGKTWTLKALEGKTLLINLWATWCGPCRDELPKFQKLYDRLKSRPEISVFTFNIDDEFGLVQPFMKENNYSFPVLGAYSYVNSLLDGIGIPQNWIVDAAGKWQWQQLGFDRFEPDWEASMTAKIESVRSSK